MALTQRSRIAEIDRQTGTRRGRSEFIASSGVWEAIEAGLVDIVPPRHCQRLRRSFYFRCRHVVTLSLRCLAACVTQDGLRLTFGLDCSSFKRNPTAAPSSLLDILAG